MPVWAGKWKGGRYYLDDEGRKVFFIERRVDGKVTPIRLKTHDEALAVGELARFLEDRAGFLTERETAPKLGPVYLTTDRINGYLGQLKCVKDHYNARKTYLNEWAQKGLDLRSADRVALRTALASFDGGHRGRTEALNAFANWLVKDGQLAAWVPLVDPHGTKPTRAARTAYTLEELRARFETLTNQRVRDVFLVRVCTGLHQTEIDQLEGCPVVTGPLPDKGAAIRELGGDHEIQGVIQVRHKTKPRHRVSVNRTVLEAALRLRASVPSRVKVWEALDPMVPSNLRHTFETLAEDRGTLVTYTGGGVDRALVAQVMGHRPSSAMIADRYNQSQIPTLVRIPFP